MPVVRKRTDEGDAAGILGKRKKLVLIAKQNHRLAGQFSGARDEFIIEQCFFLPFLIEEFIWVIEQAERIFHTEDSPASIVDIAFTHKAFIHKLMQMSIVEAVDHIHVDTGIESNLSCVLAIFGDSLRDKLYHGLPVTHNESVEAPLVLKELPQHFLIAGCRYAVKVMKRRHISKNSGIRSSLERRQIYVI